EMERAIQGLRSELEGLETDQLSAVAALERWRSQSLASLDATAAGYEEFAGLVEEIYRRRLPQARQEDLEKARDFASGMVRGLQEIADEAGNAAGQTEQIFKRAFRGLEDGLADMILRGKADWSGFLSGLAEDFLRMQIRLAVIQPLARGMEALYDGLSDNTSAAVAH